MPAGRPAVAWGRLVRKDTGPVWIGAIVAPSIVAAANETSQQARLRSLGAPTTRSWDLGGRAQRARALRPLADPIVAAVRLRIWPSLSSAEARALWSLAVIPA